jgi:predicted alpha/beta hydrolase family esterase
MRMNRAVVIVHGAGGFDFERGSGAVVSHLRRAFAERYDVRCPELPAPERPQYRPWKAAVDEALQAAGDGAYLVGHSVGGSVLLKYLSEEGAGLRPGGLFLVAAPYWGDEDWDAAEFTLRAGYAERLPPEMPVFLYHCVDDEVGPAAHAERYGREIRGAHVRLLDGRGHWFHAGLPELIADVERVSGTQ